MARLFGEYGDAHPKAFHDMTLDASHTHQSLAMQIEGHSLGQTVP